MPKINKKKSNYLTKNGGNSIDLYMGDGVSVDDNVDTKIYFVIIDTTGDGYSYDDVTEAGKADNAVIIKELKDSSVKIYSVDIDEFKKMGEIAMLNKKIKLANGEEFVEILSSITAIKGYVSVVSLGFDELKRYYLLINIKEPIFAKEYPGSNLPNYYHILESLDTLPEKYYDTLEEKYAALKEKYKQIIKSNETPLEMKCEQLEENYKILEKKNETLQLTNQALRENEGGEFKYKELQDNYNELDAAYISVNADFDESLVKFNKQIDDHNNLIAKYNDINTKCGDLEYKCKLLRIKYDALKATQPNAPQVNTPQSIPSRVNTQQSNATRPNAPRVNTPQSIPSRPNAPLVITPQSIPSRPNTQQSNTPPGPYIFPFMTARNAIYLNTRIKDAISVINSPSTQLLKGEINSLEINLNAIYRLGSDYNKQLPQKITEAHRLFRVIGTQIPDLSRYCQPHQMVELNRMYNALGNDFNALVRMYPSVV